MATIAESVLDLAKDLPYELQKQLTEVTKQRPRLKAMRTFSELLSALYATRRPKVVAFADQLADAVVAMRCKHLAPWLGEQVLAAWQDTDLHTAEVRTALVDGYVRGVACLLCRTDTYSKLGYRLRMASVIAV